MALNAVALLAGGVNPSCARPVAGNANAVGYCSTTAIYLHTPTQTPPGGRRGSITALNPSPGADAGQTTPTYPLTRIFGCNINGTIQSFDLNDEYMACVMSGGARMAIWRLADGELLSNKRVPSAVPDFFKREGAPTLVRVAGKHHILFGTTTGWVVSTNMNDGTTTHQLRLATPEDKKGTGVGNLTFMDVAPSRPDTIAVSTSEGLLFILALHPANGIRQTTVLRPFPSNTNSSDRNISANDVGNKNNININNNSNSYVDSSTGETVNAPGAVSAIAFDPNNPNYIAVGSSEGSLILLDVASSTTVQTFDSRDTPIVSITWLAGQAGTFVTTDGETNKLHVWSVSNRTVAATWQPTAAHGLAILGTSSFAPEHLFLALRSGSVLVYNTTHRTVELLTEPGHTDVMHDCRYAHHDKDLAASVSSDGTIRIWNTKQLALQHKIDVGCVIVYSADWSASGKYLVASLSNGEVVCYHVNTQREHWRTAITPGDIVRRVAWSKAESSGYIAAAYRSGVALLSHRDGKIVRRFKTKSAVLGVDFEPRHARQLTAACQDGQIVLFHTSSSRDEPATFLTGHADAASSVLFNPTVPQFLLSSSYDTTLRLWDLSVKDAHTASVTSRVLRGHTDRVTGIAWCSLAPYLALSGSYDCTVRVWDIRNGMTITTVRTHHGDVFSLSSHPERPLVFLSASRDSTMVFFHLALMRQVSLDAALGNLDRSIVSDPAALMAVSSVVSVSVIAGEAVEGLNKDLKDTNLKPHKRLERMVGFFEFPCGASDVARAAAYQGDPQDASNAKCLFIPPSRLIEVRTNRAKTLAEKTHGKSVASAGAVYKRNRLMEAADAMLQTGKVSEYCQLMVEAGEWEAAIAAAPVVSRAYWRSLCVQAGEAMEALGDVRSVRYYIMGEESARAARCVARGSDKNWDAAVTIAETCPQRNDGATPSPTPTVLQPQPQLPGGVLGDAEPSHNTTIDNNGASTVSKELRQARATAFANSSNPRIMAAALLADGSNDEAVMHLIYCGDVTLAHLLIHTVPLRQQTSIDAGYRLSMLHSCRQRQWETALLCATRQSNPYDGLATVLAFYQQSQAKVSALSRDTSNPNGGVNTNVANNTNNNSNLSGTQAEKVKAFHEQVLAECRRLQLPLDMETIQQKHANDGLASSNQLAAMALSSNTPVGTVTSEELVQTVGNFIENLLQAALQDIDGPNAIFYLKQAYTVSCYVSLPVSIPETNPSSNIGGPGDSQYIGGTAAHPPHVRKFLSFVFLVAALMCVKVYRFPKLLNPAFTKARELAEDSTAAALLAKAQPFLASYSPHSTEVHCASMGDGVPILSTGEGTQLKSSITAEALAGAVHLLEGGTSIMGKTEALQWMLCCAFSPLATGVRFLPL